MNRYVHDCAETLFTPRGRPHREWLTQQRGLTDDVLRANRIGADLGPRQQPRPEGMPRVGGIVLPALHEGDAVYAQIRIPHPRPDGPRYLNPTGDLATNPRLAKFRPPETQHREVIVTEGAIDALSANVAGYRSIAILSAAYPDQAIAHELSRLPHPLVLAFDQDEPGQQAAERLATLLDAEGRHAAQLSLPIGDLNDALCDSANWARELRLRTNAARDARHREVSRTIT
ncbi:MAG: toprim domain-containing protein [Acidimicrobiia bacterium]|nr:toprim domain-containing protein [Acidimicrobiia bacterium]